MTAHTDMSDLSRCFKFFGVFHHRTLRDFLPVLHGIHIVNHAHVYVVSFKARQQIFETAFYLFNLSRPLILIGFPCGAQVRLQNELIPAARQRFSQAVSQIGIWRLEIQIVNLKVFRLI